jgi:hypothetical protein
MSAEMKENFISKEMVAVVAKGGKLARQKTGSVCRGNK